VTDDSYRWQDTGQLLLPFTFLWIVSVFVTFSTTVVRFTGQGASAAGILSVDTYLTLNPTRKSRFGAWNEGDTGRPLYNLFLHSCLILLRVQ
jgi:hypothetical protein